MRDQGISSKRLLFSLGVGVLVAASLAGFAFRIEQQSKVSGSSGNDFAQDYVSAQTWRSGGDPYALKVDLQDRYLRENDLSFDPPHLRNPHPPSLIVLIAPLTSLSVRVARDIWMVLGGLGAAAALGLTARRLGAGKRMAWLAGASAFLLPVVHQDMRWVQSNGLILLLIVGAWWQLGSGRENLAGVLLGAATALKLFPLFLLLPLIRMRAFRAVRWHAGTAVVVSLAGALAIGMDSTWRWMTDGSPANFEFWRSAPWNISAIGIPFRWLTRSPWRPDSVDLPLVAWGLALLIGIACVIAALRVPASGVGDPFLAAIPWMILASPLVWGHYLVLALPTVMAAILRAARHPEQRSPLLPIAAAFVVLGEPPLPLWGDDVVQVVGLALPTYALILLGVLGWRRSSRMQPVSD